MSHDLSKMAAPMLLRRSRGFVSLLYVGPRYSSNSTGPAADPLKGRILTYLCNRFYDIDTFVEMAYKLKNWNVQRKNRFCIEECQDYGYEASAFIFALSLKGSVRCQGQQEWHRKPPRSWNRSLDLRAIVVEEIDLSGSVISYDGLDNLVHLEALKHLDLSRCPNIDDWSLNRLHVFADTLQELSLAGCPQITERGLASLHQLQNLKRLDVSDLPSVPNQGLIRILLEEMLPQCEIVGVDAGDGLDWRGGSGAHQSEIEEPQGVVCNQKTDKSLPLSG